MPNKNRPSEVGRNEVARSEVARSEVARSEVAHLSRWESSPLATAAARPGNPQPEVRVEHLGEVR